MWGNSSFLKQKRINGKGQKYVMMTLTRLIESKTCRNSGPIPWWYNASTIVFKSIRMTIITSKVEWEVISYIHRRTFCKKLRIRIRTLHCTSFTPVLSVSAQTGNRHWCASFSLPFAPWALSISSSFAAGGELPSKRTRRLNVSLSAGYEGPVCRRRFLFSL